MQQPPTWTPWTDGTTELRCGRLLVARVMRHNPTSVEVTIPAAPELDSRRGTTGVFFGSAAMSDVRAYIADFQLPVLPEEAGETVLSRVRTMQAAGLCPRGGEIVDFTIGMCSCMECPTPRPGWVAK